MTGDEYWSVAEIRTFLKLDRPSQYRTWHRVMPLFAPALRVIGHHKLYRAAKVREILESGRLDRRSPVHRSTALRRAG